MNYHDNQREGAANLNSTLDHLETELGLLVREIKSVILRLAERRADEDILAPDYLPRGQCLKIDAPGYLRLVFGQTVSIQRVQGGRVAITDKGYRITEIYDPSTTPATISMKFERIGGDQ